MRRLRFLPFVAMLALVFAACGEDDGLGSEPGPAAAIVPVGSASLQGVAGGTLQEIYARVVDARGRPVANQPVSFIVTAGGGWMVNNSWVSDDSGFVRDRWVLGGSVDAPQVMEARAIDRRTLDVLAIATFTATATPAVPVSISVVGDTTRILLVGDSTRVVVEGRDRFGNVVPSDQIAPSLFVSSGILQLTPTRYIRATGGGEATITASVGSTSARVHVSVPPVPPVLHVVDGPWLRHAVRAHGTIRTTGIETVPGSGQRGVAYRLEGGTLVHDGTFAGIARDLWSAGGSGPAWAAFEGGLFTSTPGGGWTPGPTFAGGKPRSISGLADGTIYVSTATPDLRPYVYRRVGEAWQDLALPHTRADSAHQAMTVTAFPGGVLATGALEIARFSGVFRPSIVRWDGASWTYVEMPPLPAGTQSASLSTPVLSRDGTVAYTIRRATLESGVVANHLLEVRGTRATVSPYSSHGTAAALAMAVGTAGQVIFVHATSWFELSEARVLSAHAIPSPWTFTAGNRPWIDADGAMWLPVAHPDRQPASSAIPTTSALLKVILH